MEMAHSVNTESRTFRSIAVEGLLLLIFVTVISSHLPGIVTDLGYQNHVFCMCEFHPREQLEDEIKILVKAGTGQ